MKSTFKRLMQATVTEILASFRRSFFFVLFCIVFTNGCSKKKKMQLIFGLKTEIYTLFSGKLSAASPGEQGSEGNSVSMKYLVNDFLDLLVQKFIYAINFYLARHKKKMKPSVMAEK